MSQVEIEGADLRTLVERARGGEEVGLTDGGEVVARIVAVPAPRTWPVQLGRLRGQFKVPEDFDAPLPDDLLDLFEGKP